MAHKYLMSCFCLQPEYVCVCVCVTDWHGDCIRHYIQTWHNGRLMSALLWLYDHARSDDLVFDARSQWVAKGQTSAL